MAERLDGLVTASFENGYFADNAVNKDIKRLPAHVADVTRDHLKALELIRNWGNVHNLKRICRKCGCHEMHVQNDLKNNFYMFCIWLY